MAGQLHSLRMSNTEPDQKKRECSKRQGTKERDDGRFVAGSAGGREPTGRKSVTSLKRRPGHRSNPGPTKRSDPPRHIPCNEAKDLGPSCSSADASASKGVDNYLATSLSTKLGANDSSGKELAIGKVGDTDRKGRRSRTNRSASSVRSPQGQARAGSGDRNAISSNGTNIDVPEKTSKKRRDAASSNDAHIEAHLATTSRTRKDLEEERNLAPPAAVPYSPRGRGEKKPPSFGSAKREPAAPPVLPREGRRNTQSSSRGGAGTSSRSSSSPEGEAILGVRRARHPRRKTGEAELPLLP